MEKLSQIAQDTQAIRERLVEKIPGHFSTRHLVSAFFGALFLGFSFILNGLLFQVGIALHGINLFAITFSTLLLLTAEIYFVGYTRVPNPHKRPFGQFWIKRIISYYTIAMFTSALLIIIYGIAFFAGTPYNTFKLIIAVSFPAAIGAALADLLGKY